ncbi:hypothetical protein K440DRAFT_612612 [Wilcoxina mikolae CBS 423.85]|nr:hypothetical protein K440DRAFT_612612 [Wilcoxina mikolae CBS 423.85]
MLTSAPVEIILTIFENISDIRSVLSLSSSCRRLHTIYTANSAKLSILAMIRDPHITSPRTGLSVFKEAWDLAVEQLKDEDPLSDLSKILFRNAKTINLTAAAVITDIFGTDLSRHRWARVGYEFHVVQLTLYVLWLQLCRGEILEEQPVGVMVSPRTARYLDRWCEYGFPSLDPILTEDEKSRDCVGLDDFDMEPLVQLDKTCVRMGLLKAYLDLREHPEVCRKIARGRGMMEFGPGFIEGKDILEWL